MRKHNLERFEEQEAQAFIKALIKDLRDLEFLVENHCVETDETRIGAEQEVSEHDDADRMKLPAIGAKRHSASSGS